MFPVPLILVMKLDVSVIDKVMFLHVVEGSNQL